MSGQGIIPENHERSVGFTGVVGTRCANDTVRRADLVIAVGTRFPEWTLARGGLSSSPSPAELAYPDRCRPQPDRQDYPATVGLVGDARRTLVDFLEALDSTTASDRTAWLRDVVAIKTAWANEVAQLRESDAFPFEPAALLTQLRQLIPDDAILVSGVGIRHAIGQHFEFRYPRTQVVGSGFGTMGQEVAAPIGVALSRPDVPVVALVGDGALLACLAALPTAVANAIDATWIVLNNRGYASIAVYHRSTSTGTRPRFSKTSQGRTTRSITQRWRARSGRMPLASSVTTSSHPRSPKLSRTRAQA